MSDDPNPSREAQISNDPDTVRNWADETGAVPVRVASSGAGEEGVRVVPEADMGDSHERLEWEEFFEEVDSQDRVLLYHGSEETEPFEIVGREEAIGRSDVDREEIEERLLEGETVTSEITETTVVESVVVEEATVESELVDSDVVDRQVLDAELLGRECNGCDIVEDRSVGAEWFDGERYFGGMEEIGSSAGAASDEPAAGAADLPEEDALADDEPYPFHAEIDLEETWSVTWQLDERFTVESRITHTDVSGSDTIEDRDIDVEGLQRTIAEEGLLDVDLSPDEVLSQCDVETEFTEGDTAHTHFTRQVVYEDEVIDRKRVRTEVAGGELLGMETTGTRTVDAEFADDEELTPTSEGGGGIGTEQSAGAPGESATGAEADATEADRGTSGAAEIQLTGDEIGSIVRDARGDEVGRVTDVNEERNVLLVDPDQSIAERIKSALDWGDIDKDNHPIHADRIEHVTDGEIHLKDREEFAESE